MRKAATICTLLALLAFAAFGQNSPADTVSEQYRFTHTEKVQDIMEIATAVRVVADLPDASPDAERRTMAMRGTVNQLALAEWILGQLDQPVDRSAQNQTAVKREFPITGTEDVVRVLFLPHTATLRDLQEVATLVRSIAGVRRLFTYTAPRAIILRGPADQAALVAWLSNDLDNPSNHKPQQYRIPGSADDIVGVFYLTHAATDQRLQEIAVQVRTITEVRRLFTYNAPKAMALRGTAEQIAQAGKLINERDR